MSSFAERRREPRKSVRGVKSWILVQEGQREPCRVVDLSRKGVRIESRRPMLPGMQVELAFVKIDDAKVTRVIRRCGNVVRRSPRGFAVNFTHPRSRATTSRFRRLRR